VGGEKRGFDDMDNIAPPAPPKTQPSPRPGDPARGLSVKEFYLWILLHLI